MGPVGAPIDKVKGCLNLAPLEDGFWTLPWENKYLKSRPPCEEKLTTHGKSILSYPNKDIFIFSKINDTDLFKLEEIQLQDKEYLNPTTPSLPSSLPLHHYLHHYH